MIRITKQTDYALVLLSHFYTNGQSGPFSAKHLSEETKLPEPIVGKILKILNNQGILSSVRGASGGYRLEKTADELSIADVVEAVEGPIHLTDCSCEEAHCDFQSHCPLRENFRHLNVALRNAFRGVSLRAIFSPLSTAQCEQFVHKLQSALTAQISPNHHPSQPATTINQGA
ncbi:MAG: SUF system Fe-S cluster assembly regulator [Candidatus Sumerlaeia bacterium]|nr:SUF system Fe-S cluster assembly regulator [Candidatus Sumerlaeia bacterium]